MKRTTNKVDLFLDSGAFSAWSQNKEIDINKYIDFIKKNKKVIDVYANLDSINDPELTFKNQEIMEEVGLNPLPVFHYGEDEKWLKRYLKKGYDCVCLGGMVPISNKHLVQWLDRIFRDYLTDNKGFPICKIHGFGLTSLSLMQRYPWYSVDSTSWVVTGRMGSIYIPRKKNGNYDYSLDSHKVAVSSRSPNMADAGKHITTYSDRERKVLLEYIEMKGYKLGKSKFMKVDQSHKLSKKNERWAEKKPKDKTVKRDLEILIEEGVSNRYQLRDEMNIIYFLDLEKSMPEWPWAFKKQGITKGLF